MGVLLLFDIWDDGFSWRGQVTSTLLAWTVVSGCWAGVAWLSLSRRARAAGVELSVAALEERQTRLLSAVPADEAWQDRIRERLAASKRAFLVLEPAPNEITFRWRTVRRSDLSVRGSLTFDPLAGTVLVEVRGGEEHMGAAGLHKGMAFIALCRIARELGLTGSKGRRGEPV
jgi:hypothetical protein